MELKKKYKPFRSGYQIKESLCSLLKDQNLPVNK